MAAALSLAAGAAGAQALAGFSVGDDLAAAKKAHAPPAAESTLGAYAVAKWSLPHGAEVSVTAAPQSGRIVYVESDWGGDAAGAASEVPGLTFGVTALNDIRRKFQSNGFGFKSNVVRVIGPDVVSFNAYQIKGRGDLVAVFVTRLPISSIPMVDGKPAPQLGKGRLDAVILADLAYLQEIWGQDRLFDPTYQPVEWK